jgi:hypothetical protein
MRTVCMGAVVDGLDEEGSRRLLHEVAVRLDEPRIDYVRLNIAARRSP